jgi:hypothetical protein
LGLAPKQKNFVSIPLTRHFAGREAEANVGDADTGVPRIATA